MKIKLIIPILCLLYCPLSAYDPAMRSLNEQLFELIFTVNAWNDPNSSSGTGSNLIKTTHIRRQLPILLTTLGVKSMLDIPCGDFYWMKEVDLSCLDQYIGADIVEALIAQNNKQYQHEKRQFIKRDLICDTLAHVDLIFCRDCLQHVPNEQVLEAIANFKRSESTYLLVSHFPEVQENVDIPRDQLTSLIRCRKINLEKAPYNFPKPLAMINEGFLGKHLALWRLADLP
jgi:hypothetical protein